MPSIEKTLLLPRTGEDGKWESHSASVDLPAGAEYTHTDAKYYCPVHGAEDAAEGVEGHWFKFESSTWDRDRNVVRCDCRYQSHDKDTRVVFTVNYR